MFTEEIMYEALVRKDAGFEGLFYAAIKTTGIFCRPTCTARKPLKQNVKFYSTAKEALLAGYRPCKICQPLSRDENIPAGIKKLINDVHSDPVKKLSDFDLRKRGLDPVAVRRWFLKHHHLTFHAYQRITRINAAFGKIKSGEPITSVAFDAGYNSLSGFTGTFKNIYGASPSNSMNKKIILYTRIDTLLGTMIACATDEAICLLEFSERKMLETELKQLSKEYNATVVQGTSPLFEQLESELKNYFDGTLKDFTVPFVLKGTPFQESVWKELLKIPYGKTCSYKDIAERLNKPTAFRAVANANGMNRIAIIIPCHRVINENGNLCGYGGGVWRKKWMLEKEQGKMEMLLFS